MRDMSRKIIRELAGHQKEKLVSLMFDYHRSHGFPYPEMRDYEIWKDFFVLQNMDAKITEHYEPLFDCTSRSIEIRSEGMRAATYFHSHIWDSYAIGMRSPMGSYVDDGLLQRAIELAIEIDGDIGDLYVRNKLGLVRGAQRCSNFRPSAAKAIYKRYVPLDAECVLDPSSGYGGRLLGFLSLEMGAKYVGVDPSLPSCEGNEKMAEFFGRSNKVEMVNSPFEDVDLGGRKFDFAFTSPPYFKKEIYSEEDTQSCHRYPDYQSWLDGFLLPMVTKVFEHLKPGCLFALNINDVNIKSKHYPLVQDTIKLFTAVGFTEFERLEMCFSTLGKNLEKTKSEPILVFCKPSYI